MGFKNIGVPCPSVITSESEKYLSVERNNLYPSKSLILPRNGSLVSLSASSSQVSITYPSPGDAVSVGVSGGWAKR